MGVITVVAVFLLLVILINTHRCHRGVTKFIVESDFLLVTGGQVQTIMGGLITYIYMFTQIFILITLLQEQIVLNEWIDSTQMASQHAEVMLTNTLLVQTKMRVT